MTSTNLEAELAVVGAGPAGLSAAVEAARHGVKVIIVDENAKPGGQLFKQIHKFFGSQEHRAGIRGINIGKELLQEAQELGVKILLDAVVWGIFLEYKKTDWGLKEIKLLPLVINGKNWLLRTPKVILATGATENALAFPGWTLPGVMGAGGVQTVINIHRILPGKRFLMVGAGNVGLVISYQLLQAGAEEVTVIEGLPYIRGYGVHASKIRRWGVPILTSHTIKEAKGNGAIEEAVIVQVDENWQPIDGTEKILKVDVICLAVGLTPSVELARLSGCEFKYVPQLGGWIPIYDENMETTVKGIYMAGDLAGIEEASAAMEEGRLAGMAVAHHLGYLSKDKFQERKKGTHNRLRVLRSSPFGTGARETQTSISKGKGLFREGLIFTGVLSEWEMAYCPGKPTKERLAKGPVAFIECVQEIPCDPCSVVCEREAIRVGASITNLPRLDENRCVGCGTCIPACPGLAIFGVDNTYSESEATISFPYEFLPIPLLGQEVEATDREGRIVGKGKVVKVVNKKGYDHTIVVTIGVPKVLSDKIRGIRRLEFQ